MQLVKKIIENKLKTLFDDKINYRLIRYMDYFVQWLKVYLPWYSNNNPWLG